MLGIISGLKRSTEGGIGKIYLGLLGSNLYSTPHPPYTIFFLEFVSHVKNFKTNQAVHPRIGISLFFPPRLLPMHPCYHLQPKGHYQ